MRVCSDRDQVFGSLDFQVLYSDGWCKSGSNSRLACLDQGDKTLILPHLSKLLMRFIKGYSKIVCPLTNLLKKERKWEWDVECQAAFQKLKDAITSEPILRLPDLELSFEVHTNMSNKALGGVLVQEGHLVAFESWKLDVAE